MILNIFRSVLPIIVTAIGGLYTEATGKLNIALEGLLTIGAFASIAGGSMNLLAFFSAAIAGMIGACILASVTFVVKSDPFISALAFNMIAQGICAVISEHLFGTRGVILVQYAKYNTGILKSGMIILLCLSVVLIIIFRKTVFGLRTRSAGSNSRLLAAGGIDVSRVRFGAYIISGLAAGIAGAYLVEDIGAWVPGISAGRGWTALVAIYLGRKSVWGTLIASLGLGIIFSVADSLQVITKTPAEISAALPYVIALIVALLFENTFIRKFFNPVK